MRRTLPVLILVVAVAAGLWYFLAGSDRSTGTPEESTSSSDAAPSTTGPTTGSEPPAVATTPDTDQQADTTAATESVPEPATESAERVPDAPPSTTAAAPPGSDTSRDTTPVVEEARSDSGTAPPVPTTEPAAVATESVFDATSSGTAATSTGPESPSPGGQAPAADVVVAAESVFDATSSGTAATSTASESPSPGEQAPSADVVVAAVTAETEPASPPSEPVPDSGPLTVAGTKDSPATAPDAAPSSPPAATDATGIAATVRQIVESLAEIVPALVPSEPADESVTQGRISSVLPEDVIGQVSVGEPAGDGIAETKERETVVGEGEQTSPGPSSVALAAGAAPATMPGLESGSGEARAVPMPEADVSTIATMETESVAGTAASDSGTGPPQETTARTDPERGTPGPEDQEPPTPPAVATGLARVAEKVEELVASLAELVTTPAPADRADDSVTQEQISSLVPEDVVERVTVREPAEGVGVDESEAPTSAVAEEELKESAPSVPAPDSEAVRIVTSGTPSEAPDSAPPPDTAATGIAGVAEKVEELVASLAELVTTPAPADRADDSVTQEQISSLVPEDVVERVTVREPAEGAGVDESEAPTSAVADGELKETAPSVPAPDSEAVRIVTSGTPSEAPDSAPPAGTAAESSGIKERVEQIVGTLANAVEQEAPPPDTAATGIAGVAEKVEELVASLAELVTTPAPADRADDSVTQEQIVSLVPEDVVERVTVREPAEGAGVDESEAPTSAVADGELKETAPSVPAPDSEAVRIVTSGTPSEAPDSAPPAGTAAESSGIKERVEQIVGTLANAVEQEAPPPDTAATGIAGVAEKVEELVASLAELVTTPAPADRADDSVTQEQIVSLVPEDVVERVTVREPAEGAGVDESEAPTSAVADGELKETAPSVPAPDSEAVRIVTSGTPSEAPDSAPPAGTAAESSGIKERVEQIVGTLANAVEQEAPPPDTAATGIAGVAEKVEELVASLAELVTTPAPADRADDSVTQEQIVSLVPEDVVERVTVREPAEGAGVDESEAPTSAVADGELKETAPSVPAPDSEAVRIVTSGTPSEAPDSAPPAGTAAESSGIKERVEQIVGTLAKLSPLPEPAEESDESVTREQVLPVVPDEAIEKVTVGDGTGEETIDSPLPVDETSATDEIVAEAQRFVETMTEPAPLPIPADKADHFVTQEQIISLVPEDIIESVTVRELKADESIDDDTPITVVRESEQIETVTPESLVVASGGDVEAPVRVPAESDEQIRQTTVREVLQSASTEPGKLISVVKVVRYFEVTTLGELLDKEPDLDALLQVIKRRYRIETATLSDLLRKQLAEDPDSIFYLHTVQPTDEQGIWGIVHFGIIDKFARGIALRRGDDVARYAVRIPRHADERLPDRSSSFLGRMIDRKTKDSFVYNFREHRMGRNPHRIFPGQELVIINFKQEELTSIYEHFAAG